MTKLASIVFALNLFACATDPQTGGDGGTCGDNKCDADETETSCPADCKPVVRCGDNKCDATETTESCPSDCPETCGNGTCGASETADSCAMDCAAQFKIANSTTSYTIADVYAWACGSSNTYVNDLNGTVPPGNSAEFDAINPGCWNFEVYFTSGQILTDDNVTLKERVLTTWTIN
jgi:hypothetical protein